MQITNKQTDINGCQLKSMKTASVENYVPCVCHSTYICE